MTKKTKIVLNLFLTAIIMLPLTATFSQAADEDTTLIQEYVKAVKNDDDKAIGEIIKKIKKNDDALKLMKKDYPEVYKSYYFEEALLKLNQIERKFAQLDFSVEPVSRIKDSSRGNSANNAVGKDRNRQSNIERVRNVSNRDRLRESRQSIGRAVQQSPNQSRTPNSTRSVRRAQR